MTFQYINTVIRIFGSQVSVLLHKIKTRKGKLTACNITNIGLAFLASATTNAVTYILVLLQFRLANENQIDIRNITSTNVVN